MITVYYLTPMNASWNGTWGFPGGMVEEEKPVVEKVVEPVVEEEGDDEPW